MTRSVLALLDFSKAYDTVWREKLLLHMLNTGIPSTFIHWIRSFLNTAGDVSNSSTSLVPADVLLKVYLKVPFLPHYCSCFTLTIWPPRLKTMQLLKTVSCLDCLQNRSLGLITSQLVSTPLEALRLEANVQSYPKLTNKAAKEGTTIGTGTILPIFLSTSIQVNNDTICEVPPTHEQVASVYQHRRVSRDAQQINNR